MLHDLEGYVPAWLIAVVAVATALTALAALSTKPPVSYFLRGVGWVFHRLVGLPVGRFLHAEFVERSAPIVREAVEAATDPLRRDLFDARQVLEAHMSEELLLVDDVNRKLASLDQRTEAIGRTVDAHVIEDRGYFNQLLGGQRTATEATDAIQADIATLNESTIGSLASDDETRRILAKPEDERTAREERHLADRPEGDDAP